MPGMCYVTSLWLDRLWVEHLEASEHARDLVQAGIKKQGERFVGFPADLHARLYLPRDPEKTEGAPAWATRLHDLASELAEWRRLRAMCARNGFAAGIAAEAMLKELLPHVPDRPEQDVGQAGAGAGTGKDGVRNESSSNADLGDQAVDSALRAALRKASRAARDAVQEAEQALEGLAGPMGFEMPGTSIASNAGPADLKAIREAHSLLKNNARLKRICELAGRMERAAASKARSTVKPGVGEIHGIELGGLADLARVLPCELGQLRVPRLRTLVLSRLLQQRALVYGMTGREPQSRGPVVVLLDESSSMRKEGRDIWSKAVALALLSTATRQKRAWHLIGFNGAITRETSIAPGKAALSDVVQALDRRCSGGTDFDKPVLRAIETMKTSPLMRMSDVVVITDGEASLSQSTIHEATELTRIEGVSWFIVGVGSKAGMRCGVSLEPIATSMVQVARLDDPEYVVDVISLSSAG